MVMTVRARQALRIDTPLLLSMVAGRAVFRVVVYGSGVVLLVTWGHEDFNRYAAAVGPAIWLTGLVAAGPEKAALKLIPRSLRTRGDLIAQLRIVVAYLPLPFLAAVAAAVVIAPASTATLYLAAAANQILLGCSLVGIALFRALDRHGRDIAHYFVLSAGTAVATGLTYWAAPAPIVYVCGLLAITAGLNAILVRGLPRYPLTNARRKVRRLLASTVVLMGAPEVLPTAAASLLYVELALTGHADESGDLFLVLTGWSFVTAVTYFLLRIFQPTVSVRLFGAGTARGQERSLHIARLVLWLTVAWFAVAVTMLLTDVAAAWPFPIMIGLLLCHTPAHILMSYSVFLLENASAAGLRTSALGGAMGTAAVAAVGTPMTAFGGAPGAVCALGAMELTVSTYILLRQRRVRQKANTDLGRVATCRRSTMRTQGE